MLFKSIVRELREMKEGIENRSRKGTEGRNWRNRTRSHIAPDVPTELIQQGQWANLPPELLLDIIRRVEKSETSWPARSVVVFCAAVCKTWRDITKEIVKSPETCGRLTFPISLKQVDVIAIDFTERLPFRLKQPTVKAAIERGVYFEITYSGLIMDAQVRRQMISNAKLLVEWTNGKNLIVSSAAPSASEIRGPYDVANLLSLFGFKSERAKASVSKNCSYVIAKSLRKKHYFKEAIKVDLLPSGGQSNTNEAPVDDWLNWDPTLKCKLNSTISDDSDSVKVTVFDKVAEQLLHKKIPELDSMTPQETSRLLTSTNVRLQNQTFLAQLRAQRKRFDDGITRFTMQQIHFNTTEEGNNSASVKTTPHDNKEPNTAKEARLSATEKEANNNKHTTIKCADRPHQHTMPATPDTPSSPLKKMRPDDS